MAELPCEVVASNTICPLGPILISSTSVNDSVIKTEIRATMTCPVDYKAATRTEQCDCHNLIATSSTSTDGDANNVQSQQQYMSPACDCSPCPEGSLHPFHYDCRGEIPLDGIWPNLKCDGTTHGTQPKSPRTDCYIMGRNIYCPYNQTIDFKEENYDSSSMTTKVTTINGLFTCPLEEWDTWPGPNPADEFGYCKCIIEDGYEDDDPTTPTKRSCNCLGCASGGSTFPTFSYACIDEPLFDNCFNYSCAGRCNVPIVEEKYDRFQDSPDNHDGGASSAAGPTTIIMTRKTSDIGTQFGHVSIAVLTILSFAYN